MTKIHINTFIFSLKSDMIAWGVIMNYEIIRNRRKTISISIDRYGNISVKAPYNTPEAQIQQFIDRKQHWIDRHISEISEKADIRRQNLSSVPVQLPLLGAMCKVVYIRPYGYNNSIFYLPEKTMEQMLPNIQNIYRSIAKKILIPRTKLLADRLGITVTDVRINSARTRWGSCSSKKVINLSWKLVTADEELIDYVIVHELCHTRYMDHSEQFWDMVGHIMPDYERRRQALHEANRILYEYGLE